MITKRQVKDVVSMPPMWMFNADRNPPIKKYGYRVIRIKWWQVLAFMGLVLFGMGLVIFANWGI